MLIIAQDGVLQRVQSEDKKQTLAFTNISMMGAQHTSSMETSTTSTLPWWITLTHLRRCWPGWATLVGSSAGVLNVSG